VPVQPNVKISEVNTKQYQKPKKVAVNEADKYNLNQDYDIYENQVKIQVTCYNELNKIVKIVFSAKMYFFCMHLKMIFLFRISGSVEQEQVPYFRRSTVQVRKLFFR